MNIFHCGYKGLSDEFIKSPTTPDNSLPPSLSYTDCRKKHSINFSETRKKFYLS